MTTDCIPVSDKAKILSDLWTRSQQRYVSLVRLYFLMNMALIGLFVFLRAENAGTEYYVVWWVFAMFIIAQMSIALAAAREEGAYFGWALKSLEATCCTNNGENAISYGFYGCSGEYVTTNRLIGGIDLLHNVKWGCTFYHEENENTFTKQYGLAFKNKWYLPRLAVAPGFFFALHTAILFYACFHLSEVQGGIDVILR